MAACLPHELKPIAGWEVYRFSFIICVTDDIMSQQLLRHPLFYKHNGYTKEEQNKLGLRGLVPPEPLDMDTQAARCLMQLRSKTSPLEKYIYLSDLQERDEHLYFKVVIENIKEVMIISNRYTVH
jgi:malate dehydrogenase (oxaloacetate-decarboxylating)(NADP+)